MVKILRQFVTKIYIYFLDVFKLVPVPKCYKEVWASGNEAQSINISLERSEEFDVLPVLPQGKMMYL